MLLIELITHLGFENHLNIEFPDFDVLRDGNFYLIL